MKMIPVYFEDHRRSFSIKMDMSDKDLAQLAEGNLLELEPMASGDAARDRALTGKWIIVSKKVEVRFQSKAEQAHLSGAVIQLEAVNA